MSHPAPRSASAAPSLPSDPSRPGGAPDAARVALVAELVNAAFPPARSPARIPWPLQVEARVVGERPNDGREWVPQANSAWVWRGRPDPDDQRLARVAADAPDRLVPLAREAAGQALRLWLPTDAQRAAVLAAAGPRARREATVGAPRPAPTFACGDARRALTLALGQVAMASLALAPRALLALAGLVVTEDLEAMYQAEWSPLNPRSPVRRDPPRLEVVASLSRTLAMVPRHRSPAVVTFARSATDERWVVEGLDLPRVRAAELEAVMEFRGAGEELGELRPTLFVMADNEVELMTTTGAVRITLTPALHGAALSRAQGDRPARVADSRLRGHLRRAHGADLDALVVVDAR